MRYGAMNFPITPVIQEIETFAALGFDYLELAMDPPRAHYTTLLENKDRIRKALETRSMGLICHLPTFVSTADLTESIRNASLDEMIRSLETASALGASKVVVHPGHIGGLAVFRMDEARKRVAEGLDRVVRKAARLGLRLCLENMFPQYNAFVEPSEFSAAFKTFPGLELTLDIGHANIGSPDGKRIRAFIRRLGSRIGHVHVSDNHGQADEHLPLGAGTINFAEVVRDLETAGYNDTITFEIFTEERWRVKDSRERFAAMTAKY